MAYISREIKDRVVIGDNYYRMKTSGKSGVYILTPEPDEVVEEGTPVNKELLQPIEDRVVWLMNRVFDDIVSNPFEVTFNTLQGVTVTGIWNENLARVEC